MIFARHYIALVTPNKSIQGRHVIGGLYSSNRNDDQAPLFYESNSYQWRTGMAPCVQKIMDSETG